MDRSIGINFDKEASKMMKHRKFPALNHTTKLHTEYVYDGDSCSSNKKENNNNSCECGMEVEFCVNGHTYKMNKQNLVAVGVGALVALSAYKAYKVFSRI